jgi:hypothetical protein
MVGPLNGSQTEKSLKTSAIKHAILEQLLNKTILSLRYFKFKLKILTQI